MNWDQIEGNWKQFKGKVQKKWGDLTDDECDQIAGNREQLEGKIQEKYGKTKEEAKRQVDEWLAERTVTPPDPAVRQRGWGCGEARSPSS